MPINEFIRMVQAHLSKEILKIRASTVNNVNIAKLYGKQHF